MNQVIKLSVPCVGCRQMVEIDVQDQPSIINLPGVSVIVVEHSREVFCPNCQKVVRPAVAAVPGMALLVAPIPPEAQSQMIVPAGISFRPS